MNIKNSAEQMKMHVDAWKKSGLSMQAYSKRNNLSYYTFLYWLDKFGERKRNKRKPSAAAFAQVKVIADKPVENRRLEFHVPGKGYFLFPGDCSSDQIKKFLQALC